MHHETLAQTRFIGMDVSEKSIEIYELAGFADEGTFFTRDNMPDSVNNFFDRYEDSSRVVVAIETGSHSPWLFDLLDQRGFKVYVGNARKLRMIYKNDDKCDPEDAKMLARMARFDPTLLYPIQLKKREHRIDMLTIKARDSLVKTRTMLINAVRGLVKPFGVKIGTDVTVEKFYPKVVAYIPKELKSGLAGVIKEIKNLNLEIKNYDKKINKLCGKYPATKILRQVKGVGPITALTFVLVISDPRRFSSGKKVGKYVGLTPKRDQSGDVDKQLSITKAGNKLLRRLLTEAANYIMGRCGEPCYLQEFGCKIAAKGGNIAKRKAKTAVARKLSVLLYSLWMTGEEYQPMGKKKVNG